MVAITATSSASPSLQASLSKVRLEQARREADRAEADAQNLRARADEAEREARTGRDKVRQLSSSSTDTASATKEDTTYTQQLRAAEASETPPKVQNFMERLYKATSDKFTASGNPLKTNEGDNTVVNSQGQATGRILNVQA
jgi:dsDNA-specific endonuclease/ATPase MutS2